MQWKNTQTLVLSWSDVMVFMYGERHGKKPKPCEYNSGICYLLPQDLNELSAVYISSPWTMIQNIKASLHVQGASGNGFIHDSIAWFSFHINAG